jgi:hypothetical protein
MDYKKKYVEALERAKKELNVCGSQDCDAARQIFRLFPELENKDEKIKEEIISALKWANHKGVYDKHIAWLESQGTPQVRTGLEWGNTIDAACNKRYLEDYSDGEYCHEQSFKWGFQEGVEWFKKQGANKPFDYENVNIRQNDFAPKSAMEAIKEEKIDNANWT